MGDFCEINLNSKQYILVDTYKYKGDNLFHFGALSLDDETFCKKENEEYIPITDEFEIAIIKNKFGLINLPYYYDTTDYLALIKKAVSQSKLRLIQNKIYRLLDREPLSVEEADKIRKEQIDNFKMIKEKFNLDIDLEDIINKINKVKIFKANKLRKYLGYYRPSTNSIVYRKYIVDEETIANKKTRLHEFVHAMTGKSMFLYPFTSGLIEGQTENLAQSMYNDNTSTKELDYHERKDNTIHYNFSRDTSYKNLVTLVQQMEYATGKKSHESIIKGNMSFEYEFAKEYGLPLMAFMAYRMKRLHIEEYGLGRSLSKITGRHFDVAKYLKETQDILMEKVFEKDFGKVENLEDAKKYLEKLRNFETVRAKISTYYYDKHEKIEDTSFEKYYYKKFGDISKLLEEKGMSRESIDTELEQYKYEEQEYKPVLTKEEESKYMKWSLTRGLGYEVIENNNIIDIRDCEVKAFRMSNKNDYNYFIIKKGTNEGYFIKRDLSGRTEKIFENISEDEKSTSNGNLTDKIKLLRDNGFEEIDLEINPEEIKNGIIDYLEEEIKRNEKRINKYKEKEQERSNYIQEENKCIINLLSQYGKEYESTTEIESTEEKEEEQKEESLQDIFIKGFTFATISMKNLIKNALGNQNIRLEDVKKADRVESKEQEQENTKEGVDR